MSKSKKNNVKNEKTVFIVASIVVIVLSILLLIARNFGDFNNVRIRKNNKTIFSITDLTVDNIKFSDTEADVKKQLGQPKKEKNIENGIYTYKKLYYDGLVVTLKENYDNYMVTGVDITSRKYKSSRNIKVGDGIVKVLRKYKVQNPTGTYIYGNYTIDALSNNQIKENIYMAVRSKKEVVYINKDASTSNNVNNIARLNISYKNGKVTKISWSYDFE